MKTALHAAVCLIAFAFFSGGVIGQTVSPEEAKSITRQRRNQKVRWPSKAVGTGLEAHPTRCTHRARITQTETLAQNSKSPTSEEGGGELRIGSNESTRFEYTERHMGAVFGLQLYAPSEDAANQAAASAFARIKALDTRLSDYQHDSELNRLSRSSGSGQAIPVSDDLWRMIDASQTLSERTGGAFDVTAGPIIRLWRHARRTGKLPPAKRLERAKQAVGHRLMRLDRAQNTVELTKPNMRLDLGGIAKGFAADEALRMLRECGITAALVDAGGDLAVGDPPPGKEGWRIAVAPIDMEATPRQMLLLSGCGVATSGDAFQYVEIDGTRYSHIVDPRTGLGLTISSSVTVIAPDCTTADSLASAISVLGPKEGMALADETPGVAAAMARREGQAVRRYESLRMKEMKKGRARRASQ